MILHCNPLQVRHPDSAAVGSQVFASRRLPASQRQYKRKPPMPVIHADIG